MKLLRAVSAAVLLVSSAAFAQPQGWGHSGELVVLTTPDGANLPAGASLENFPLLVRLHKDWFDFAQAKPNGDDIRFSDANGAALPYEIEFWDAAKGEAAVWVRVPKIAGNARQALKMHWGKADATSESSGAAVFNEANGYASVLHMDGALKDETGVLTPKDLGTTAAEGIVGAARHLERGKGILAGDHVATYPFGDGAFTSEVWYRPTVAGTTIFYWGRYATRLNGKTGDGNEVGLNIGAPPSLSWSSDGPGGASTSEMPVMGQWNHVAATYENGINRIYVNGHLAGERFHKAAMSIVKDVVVSIGGMRGGDFRYEGDIDEVRVSRVARSAHWLKLQYENQRPMQTAVGPLVPAGNDFSVSQTALTLREGQSATITAKAGGAQKIYWILKKDGGETLAAVDRFAFILPAGRVTADTALTLQLKVVDKGGVKTKDIPITIKEDIPEPVAQLKAPAKWNGRDTIEVVPTIKNLAAMQAKGAGDIKTTWSVLGGAVIKEIAPGKLILKRSQFTGNITVRAALGNGGIETVTTATIAVKEPARDAWVQRVPGKDEQPEENQFYARDDKNEGTLFYNGTLTSAADEVFLKLYANGKLQSAQNQKPKADKSYAFTAKLKPGLINYKVEFGTKTGGGETVVKTVDNLICGDAYIIEGQSNAEATGPNNGPAEDPVSPVGEWIRSYGNQHQGSTKGGWGNAVRTHIWGKQNYGDHQIGAWGMPLAVGLVTKYSIPVCFINGAVGGTPIFQHQPNPANRFDTSGEFYANPYKIYGSLLTRVTAAKLTHGIRGVIWHQGENDSGSGAPTGDWNYKSYQRYFVDMAAAWKQDFPNIQHYYVFQVWPLPCSMGPKDDHIREAQRTLPHLFSNLRTMSTIGAAGEHAGRGWCHFDLDGYAQFARFISPLLEQDNYGLTSKEPVTAPNLLSARFTSAARDEIALDFGQPVAWKDEVKRSFYLDETVASIASASVAGNVLTLKLAAPSQAKTITYLTGRGWDGKPAQLLFGTNGIAALTFCEVPIAAAKPLQ